MRKILLIEFALFFTSLSFVGTLALLTQRPDGDFFGLLCGTVELNCSTNLNQPVNWEFSTYGSSKFSWIYLNALMTQTQEARYKIDVGNGNYHLIIESVDWSYAGKYRCTDQAGLGESATAQLTVLDPTPRCNGDTSPCFSDSVFYSFDYLGDAVPTLNLSEYTCNHERPTQTDPSTADPQKKTITFNITFDQRSEKNNTNATSCVRVVNYAVDGKPPCGLENDRGAVYKITLNNLRDIGFLSFPCPSSTKIPISQHLGGVNSNASCSCDERTIGLSIVVAIASLGLVALSVYIVYLKRIITNLKRGSDGATPTHHPSSPGGNSIEVHRYEHVEGDLDDSFPGEANYDALGQRENLSYKPRVYDRLKGASQSTQSAKHQEEPGVQVSTAASWNPTNSRKDGRGKSNVEENYITLVQ